MRFLPGLALLLCARCLFAQADDPEIARAKAEIDKLRGLVQAGALPRAQLAKAEDRLADAEDVALLRKTLYGQDLTAEQSDEMIAAANRRFERRKKAFDEAQKLVQAGVASQASLDQYMQELDLARKECDLAESRAKLTAQLAEMARAEEALDAKLAQAPAEAHTIAERFDGDGVFTPSTFNNVETAFTSRFGKPLPVSAMGETAVHRALGFDHRGRVDVAVSPDQPEGVWLREYLAAHHIPYFAFRQAVPGKATGAHIHLGPMSTRLKLGG
jgi:multidrug efflux pump subunit AcrA (membrane-fusion protein)